MRWGQQHEPDDLGFVVAVDAGWSVMAGSHIAAALLAASIAAASAWQARDWRMDAQISALKREHSAERAKAMSAQQTAENTITHKYQGALNAARDRETALRAAAARARAQSDGLRKQAATAERRLGGADVAPGAVIEYASAANELLADCSRRYQELGALADGHAADVRALSAAWPVMPEVTP